MTRLFLLFMIFSALPVQAAEIQEYVINKGTFRKVNLRNIGDVQSVLEKLEYPENEVPQLFICDFNNNGINDYLIESYKSLCGNGGCVYQIIDGKSGHSLGEFF